MTDKTFDAGESALRELAPRFDWRLAALFGSVAWLSVKRSPVPFKCAFRSPYFSGLTSFR